MGEEVIRRSFLQMLLASPLLGLLKGKAKSPVLSETTGTSGGWNTFWTDGNTERHFANDRLIDPTSHWAKEMAKEAERIKDETIIKAMKK